jgi:phthalate 4,5-dioxygenase
VPMLSREENELLTQTGPGTPMGELMRRYWVPALLSNHLTEPDCPPVRVRLLGENLVAFRDTAGRVGLLGQHCPHRGASLFFGRNEEVGLRCVYHGWKFDATGACVDMPNEPPESSFKHKVRATAYPCIERGGIVWAYMGPPALQPEPPAMEWAVVPASHRHVTRRLQESNWLQGLEGGFDPTHLAFLHRGARPATAILATRPRTAPPAESAMVPTGCGLMFGNRQPAGPGETLWSVNQWLMPFHKLITVTAEGAPLGAHAWVPIDDESCLLYTIEYRPDRPLSTEDVASIERYALIHAAILPGSDRTVLNRDNDYLIDREAQRSGESFTGIRGIGQQDSAIQESMGAILDRTTEHLGASDCFIIAIRRYLLKTLRSVQEGGAPPGLDPATHQIRAAAVVTEDAATFADAVAEAVVARSPAYTVTA